jgi:phosphatidylserine/phosphatidylglycerophosphate/cardiolipin synthase-like enzyme
MLEARFDTRAMTAFADGKIEAYVGPPELGAPDDLERVIVEFIGGAKQSLDIAVQELDSIPIAQAILDARWRGVDVDVYLEQDYLRSELTGKRGQPPPSPPTKGGETAEQALFRTQWLADETKLAENRRILSALLRSDIEVRGDFNPKIFHQKFVLRDYRGKASPTSALLTGSANFTGTDTHTNLNHIIVFRHAHVCRQYEVEVEQLRGGSFGRRAHGEVPKVFDVAGVPVKILFAPDHTPELEIVKQMLKGTKEIVFAIFTFAGSSGIDDAMLALAKGGMEIRGVLDRGQARQNWAAPQWLKHANIKLFIPKREGDFAKLRKLHHKLMVIDERIVVAGSFNYTEPANAYNDENIFVLGSTHQEVEGIEVDGGASGKVARFMKAEVDRIIALSEPYVPGP